MTRVRVAREDGIALALAVVILVVMTIMATAIIDYTSESSRDSSSKQGEQRAYALAEGGLNQALAQLASHYYDSSGNAVNTATLFATTWFNGLTSSQQSPSNSNACTTTSTCMSWALVSCSFTSTVSGCTNPGGTLGITQGTVVLSGTGTVPNPTGAAPIHRTIQRQIDVQQPPNYQQTPSYWKEIFTGAPPSTGCDLSLGQGVTITAPLYVGGNLCLTNTARIYGSTVNLKVMGWVWLRNAGGQNGTLIGSQSGSPARVNTAQIAGGCSDNNNQQPTMSPVCQINKNGGSIWASNPSTQYQSSNVATETLPSVNWTWVQNSQQNSTPAPSCTNGRSLSEANFSLTPNASYTCTSAIGSIKYTYVAGGTSTLAVSGDIFFPGNMVIDTQNKLVKYTGVSSLFVAGTVTGANNSFICVQTSGNDCDFANATNSGSSGYWDASKNLLLLHSQGAISATNLHFQGGMYSTVSITLTGGQGCTQGPLVTPQTIIVGQQLNGSFPVFPDVVSGSLGTSLPPYTLGSPYGGTS